MNWFTKLFKKKDVEHNKEERVLDIKEPIYSFVECFKEKPSRFKLGIRRDCYTGRGLFVSYHYELLDKQTNRLFKATRVDSGDCWGDVPSFSRYPDFLSNDEIRYIYSELSSFGKERLKRMGDILDKRAKRKADKEREQLMKDYCGDIE